MSKVEIVTELAKLPHEDRRDIARLIFEMEADAQILRECDRRADDRFLMLDLMEQEDAKTKSP